MSFESPKRTAIKESAPTEPSSFESLVVSLDLDAAAREKLVASVTEKIKSLKQTITDLTIENKRYKELSTVDILTGAPNLLAMHHEFERIRAEHARDNTPTDYSLIFFDLNNLKTINDTHGHQAGDETLIAVVRTLKDTIRAPDMLIRKSGDEFYVILPKTNEDGAALVAERVLEVINGKVNTELRKEYADFHGVSASIGVASMADVEKDMPELTDELLMHTVDTLMYEAKKHKKIDPLAGKIVRYSERSSLNQHTNTQLELDLENPNPDKGT